MHALHITCNRSTQILINQESGKDSNCKMIECYVSGLVFEIYAMFLEVSPLATKSCPNFDWGGIEPCVTPKYKITKLLIGVGFNRLASGEVGVLLDPRQLEICYRPAGRRSGWEKTRKRVTCPHIAQDLHLRRSNTWSQCSTHTSGYA